jgi:AGZA family xanthine/uracil permease-like MFS transporter
MGLAAWLDTRFKVTERGSTLGTEFRAGTVTFMTMAYILLVNPTILSGAGMPFRPVASATALSAIIGCTFIGLAANLPFCLSPGMGLNAYFAFGVCVATSMTYDVALTACLIEGVLFSLLTLCGASEYIQRIMPHNLKHAITVGIGLFQAFIGFRMTGLVVPNEDTLVALGNVMTPYVALGVATTLLIAILTVHQVQGAMLIGVVLSSCVSWVCGLHPLPTSIVEAPTLEGTWLHFNFGEYAERWRETIPITLAFLFVALFDTAGVQFGAGLQAGLVDPITHKLPGSSMAFLGSSLATIAGACLGTSPVIIANESCAGIADGGRTGLTALVSAAYFSLSVFFIPIFSAVPPTATAPALIIVGARRATRCQPAPARGRARAMWARLRSCLRLQLAGVRHWLCAARARALPRRAFLLTCVRSCLLPCLHSCPSCVWVPALPCPPFPRLSPLRSPLAPARPPRVARRSDDGPRGHDGLGQLLRVLPRLPDHRGHAAHVLDRKRSRRRPALLAPHRRVHAAGLAALRERARAQGRLAHPPARRRRDGPPHVERDRVAARRLPADHADLRGARPPRDARDARGGRGADSVLRAEGAAARAARRRRRGGSPRGRASCAHRAALAHAPLSVYRVWSPQGLSSAGRVGGRYGPLDPSPCPRPSA